MKHKPIKLMEVTIELYATPTGIDHRIAVKSSVKEVSKLADGYVEALHSGLTDAGRYLSGSLLNEYKKSNTH